jgi:hypothetical protein
LLKIQACTFRGLVHGWLEGNWELGAAYAREAIRLTEQADVPRKSVFGYVTLGLAHYSRQAWADAAATLEIARQAALAQRFRADGARRCDIGLAWSYLHLGRKDEAAVLFHSVVAEEEADIESLHLITCALAGLAATCPDPGRFQAQCEQIEAERAAGAKALPLVQWQPKPAQRDLQFAIYDLRLPETEAELVQQAWKWEDPFGDCLYTTGDGLTIQAANYRDLWLNNLGAPRLLRAVQGAFALETRCRVPLPDRPAMGGLLLWQNQKNYLRLTWNTHGPGEINLLGCLKNRDLLLGRGALPQAEQIYLRLERIGAQVRALYSADGDVWSSVGAVEFAVADPVEIGLLAVGFIPRYVYPGSTMGGTAIRFASLQLWRGCAP